MLSAKLPGINDPVMSTPIVQLAAVLLNMSTLRVLLLLGRTLLVNAPVIDSSVLAVRRTSRFGDTLTTSLRCAIALTVPAFISTVSA